MKIKFTNYLFLFRKRLLFVIMRTFILLFCTTIFAFTSESSFSQVKISIDRDQLVTVNQVFRIVKKQTNYGFIYPKRLFKGAPKIQLKKGEIELKELLNKSLVLNNLQFKVLDDKTIVIKEELLNSTENKVNFEQRLEVKGLVTDESGQPLPGANILEKGTTNGVQTDFDGKYTLEVTNQTGILIVSYLGYTTQEVQVQGQSTVNVILEEDTAQLDEVVVVGYGTQKKSDLTGAVVSVSSERLEEKPNTNFTQVIQGALPGITVNTNASGAEQNDVSILIRGRNSINASNSPLIVYDGVPYSGSISDINPIDIKSISVLKDASATAIYGARGANGVILIETKRGTGTKPQITFSTYTGVLEIAKIPEVYDGQGFAGFKETREPGELTQSEVDKLIAGEYTDWLDLTTRTGIKQEHNLSISGATKKVKYYVSLGTQDVKGVAKNDRFQRVSLRTNLNFDITSNLKFGTSTQLSRIDRSGLSPSFSSEAAGAYFTNPLTTAFNPDGGLTIFPWPEENFFTNPLAPTLAVNDDINKKIFTSNFLEYKFPFLDGLSYKLNTGIEYGTRNEGTYWGRDTARGYTSNGEAIVENSVSENYLIEHILNYQQTYGNHTLGFTGLYSSQKTRFEKNDLTGVGFPSDLLTYHQQNLALGLTPRNIFTQTTLISQMGRLNYNYKQKYFGTFTLRRDGFSGFGDNNKYGIFPSAALSWKISEENFFSENGFVNNLKLRLSYGENGNQAVGPYDNLARLDDYSYLDGDTTAPGFIPDQLANNSLSWETTSTYNLGLDIGLLNNRFEASIDLYESNTSDLLLDRLIPSVHGITEVTQNIGETKNRGIEVALKGFVVNSKSFTWNTDVNFSYNENEIVSLFGKNQDDVANELFIGKPISSNYGFQFDGIWQVGDDIAGSAQPNAVPGDVKVLDITNPLDASGNPILGISASDDRVVQGQTDPKIVWGMNNTFGYKNFSLNVFIQGVGGVTKRNTIKDVNVFGGVKRNWYVQDYWTPDNPITTYHRNHIDANINNVRFYENADFIRIKDITLSYNIDKKIFKDSDTNIKLYFTGRNLFTITNWEGLDPELNSQRSIPLQKEFVFGLNLRL